MPMCKPWTAPEWKAGHRYAFSEAKKMDAYSFGRLCFWLILGSENGGVDFDSTGEESKEMETIVHQLLAQHIDLQIKQKETVRELFSLTLKKDPKQRCGDFDQLLSCLTMDK